VLYQWRPIWIFSAAASAVVLVVFLFTFHDTDTHEPQFPLAEPMREVPL
jgi:hypothetical protein